MHRIPNSKGSDGNGDTGYLRDISGLGPDHYNKASVSIK